MRWHGNVDLIQATKQPAAMAGKRARWAREGVLLREEASSRDILAEPTGARLKTP